jgi:hypothetical protein
MLVLVVPPCVSNVVGVTWAPPPPLPDVLKCLLFGSAKCSSTFSYVVDASQSQRMFTDVCTAGGWLCWGLLPGLLVSHLPGLLLGLSGPVSHLPGLLPGLPVTPRAPSGTWH